MKQIALILVTFSFFLTIRAQETTRSEVELKSTFYLRYEGNRDLTDNAQNRRRISGFGSPRPLNIKAVNLNNLGADSFLGKNYTQAIEYFRQAAELAPEYLQIQVNLANALLNGKQPAEAADICRQSIDKNAPDGAFYAILGGAFYELGKYSESVGAFEKAVGWLKENEIIFNDLGKAYYQLNDHQAALAAFEKALKLKPDFPDVLNNYGVTLIKLKRYKEAVVKFQAAIKQQPEFAEAHNNLGIAYSGLGKKKQALQSYLETVRLNPDWSYGQYNLAKGYLVEGKREEARHCLEILKKLDTELAEKFHKEFYQNYVIDVSQTT